MKQGGNREETMTRQQKLDVLMLLSAMESWSFSLQSKLPDYLHEQLGQTMTILAKEVLNNGITD